MGGRLKKEGIYAYLQLIHIVVQQKVAQHCKANILPLKKRKRNILVKFTTFNITLAERISIIKIYKTLYRFKKKKKEKKVKKIGSLDHVGQAVKCHRNDRLSRAKISHDLKTIFFSFQPYPPPVTDNLFWNLGVFVFP